MKKVCAIFLCLMMCFAYIPTGIAEETNPLPQTPTAYAASDYAKYAARMAVGEKHIVVINANGAVVAGGDNTDGQCNVPAELTGVKVKAVAAGSYHTLALTEDGRVFAWGQAISNASSTKNPVTIPAEVVAEQGNIKLIAAGASMSAVVTNANKVIAWGFNSNNLGTIPGGLTDVTALALSNNCAVALNAAGNVTVWGDSCCTTVPDGLNGNAVAIAVGQYHWLALKKDGTVTATGSDGMLGMCGDIVNQTDVRAIVGGWQFAGAILSDGSVKGWGRTPAGQEEVIAAGANIKAFTCTVSGGLGAPALCAMQGDGTIKVAAPDSFITAPITSGFNFLTVPSNNAALSGLEVAGYTISPPFDSATDTYTVNVPTTVKSVNITATTTDPASPLKINGVVSASGSAQTVSNLAEGDNLIPVLVTGADFTTTKTYNLTIRRDPLTENNNPYLSNLQVEGYTLDQTFNEATTAYTLTVPYETSSVNITAVTVATGSGLKISGVTATSGTAQTNNLVVGSNPVDVAVTAADGTTAMTYTLTITRLKEQIPMPQTPAAYAASDLVRYASRMAAGYTHLAVIDANGNLKLGGDNTYGQLKVPEGLTGKVKAVTVGTYHTLVLTEDGKVLTSGSVLDTDGTTLIPAIIPDEVKALQGSIKLIAAGGTMSAVLTNSGKLIVWGYNTNNLATVPAGLGNVVAVAVNSHCVVILNEAGNVTVWGDSNCTTLPGGLDGNVVAIATGQWHWLALKKDGTVSVTGNTTMTSQCGNISKEANARAVAGGSMFAAALLADGSVKVWGKKFYANPNGRELISSDNNIKAFTSIISSNTTASPPNAICAMQGDGKILVQASGSFPYSPITAEFNFLTGADDNANLSGLAVSGYDLSPTFAAGTTEYTVNIPNEISSVNVTATTDDINATLKINGATATSGIAKKMGNLRAGDNRVEIVVTAKNGSTNQTYTLIIKRAAALDDNSLASLTVESVVYEEQKARVVTCGIYPEISWGKSEGIVDVAYETQDLRITAQPTNSEASLEINGMPATAGVATVITAQNLAAGYNLIPIKVTAADGSPRSYTLHVKRVSSQYALPALPQTPQAYQESDYAKYNRRLAIGNMSVLAVKKDGTVIAWGSGNQGTGNIPADLANVVAVAIGHTHSLALKKDGTVAAWGEGRQGSADIPVGLQNIVDISAGTNSSVALDQDGQVYAWGACGNIPDDLSNVVDIQCGAAHTLALKADGTVVVWGNNDRGQCDVPAGLNHVVAIAADGCHSVALKDDGTMAIWGGKNSLWQNIKNNDLQYLKGISANGRYITGLKWDGSMVVLAERGSFVNNIGVPLQPEQETLAVISSNLNDGILALNKDGTLAAWGDNNTFNKYDIPAGLNLFADDPAPYSGPSPNIPQTPAAYAASNYALAAAKICLVQNGVLVLNIDGTVKLAVSGKGDYDYTLPQGLTNVTAIAYSGRGTLMALKADGTVVVWGYDGDHQSQVPADLGRVKAIATGAGTGSPYCLALQEDGTVAAWGGNTYHQCDVPAGLANVTVIAAADKHCLALKADGTVVAWGDNTYGQCDVPAGLNNVARIYVGDDFSLALKNDGTVVAWGSNRGDSNKYYCGQCDVPEGLNGVVDIVIYGQTCIALKNNGTVVVWGNNMSGKRNIPPGLHDVAAISSANGVAAIMTDGTVVNWGYSIGGSLDNSRVRLAGLSQVLTISNWTAIFRDGTLKYFNPYNDSSAEDLVNAALAGVNVLSGYGLAINRVELFNPAGDSINSVTSPGSYRIDVSVGNNNAVPATGVTIIQVRGGAGATGTGGGRVLGCVAIPGDIPANGSTVSSDFTMPAGISGTAYVDVFVWDGCDTMVPLAAANQNLSFEVEN